MAISKHTTGTLAPAPETLLKRLARSFYLSLRLLPEPMRGRFARAYLFARAADTVADTEAVAPTARETTLASLEKAAQQLAQGEQIRLQVPPLGPGGNHFERALMEHLPLAGQWLNELAPPPRSRVGEVTTILIAAMRRDWDQASSPLRVLPDEEALANYLYGNAGCVGRYWAQELAATTASFSEAELPAMEIAGQRLGEALQRVNVLRDLGQDLHRGRCNLPQTLLSTHNLSPGDLGTPKVAPRLTPLITAQIERAHRDLEAGCTFLFSLPRGWIRQRAAAALPAILARGTLDRIEAQPERILDTANPPVKVPRREVRFLLMRLLLAPPSNRTLARLIIK